MEENKTSNKGLIVLVVILSILLIGATSYICYDKLMVKEEPVADNEPKQEKLSEEEVTKLHESLLSVSKSTGFYFDEKVSIEDIPADVFIGFVMDSYISKQGIKYDADNFYQVCGKTSAEYYICEVDENGKEKKVENDTTKQMTISKNVIDNYIKEKFGANKDFVVDTFHAQSSNNVGLNGYYNSTKEEYYLTVAHHGGGLEKLYSKILNYEQNDDELIVYDKAFFAYSGESGIACDKAIKLKEGSSNTTFLIQNNSGDVIGKNGKVISDGSKYIDDENQNNLVNEDAIFEDFASDLYKFKHTFKKADDSKYYWYSSEIINE